LHEGKVPLGGVADVRRAAAVLHFAVARVRSLQALGDVPAVRERDGARGMVCCW